MAAILLLVLSPLAGADKRQVPAELPRLMVRVGDPRTLDQARVTAARLRQKGVAAAVGETRIGIFVSAGEFVDPRKAVRRWRRVVSAGFSPVRLVVSGQPPARRLPPEARRLIQVRAGKPGSLARARRLAEELRAGGFAAVPVRSTAGFVVSAGAFDIPANALRQRDRLRAAGYPRPRLVALPRKGEPGPAPWVPGRKIRLHMVRLGRFPGWDPALMQAARLRQAGFPAQVFATPEGPGAAVSVGDYSRRSQALEVVIGLRQAGFPGARVVTVRAARAPEEKEKLPRPSRGREVLVLGKPSEKPAVPLKGREGPAALAFGPDSFRLEGGRLLDPGPVSARQYLHAGLRLRWNPGPRWTFRAAGRADGYRQTGAAEWEDADLGPGETYLRFRIDWLRLTFGYQKVLWGRIDEVPPTDGLGVRDLRRFLLDDYVDRRLPAPALRAELFGGPLGLDLVWLPVFRPAVLPERESLWSPVDPRRGRLLGLPADPLLAVLVRAGSFRSEEGGGDGGGGARLEYAGASGDFALTLQRVRRSVPYYELHPDVRAALTSGQPPGTALEAGSPTFAGRHPWTWLAGGDLALDAAGAVWRAEVGWRGDVPVTTEVLAVDTVPSLDWAAGVELYPGGRASRLSLQVVGRDLLAADEILDRDPVRSLTGTLARPFAHARWRARIRFLAGLDRHEVYLNPELTYRGLEPHSLYLAGHLFEGHPVTPAGFHRGHDLVVLGWRSRF